MICWICQALQKVHQVIAPIVQLTNRGHGVDTSDTAVGTILAQQIGEKMQHHPCAISLD